MRRWELFYNVFGDVVHFTDCNGSTFTITWNSMGQNTNITASLSAHREISAGGITTANILPGTNTPENWKCDALSNQRATGFMPVGGSLTTGQRNHSHVNEIPQSVINHLSPVTFVYDGSPGPGNGNRVYHGRLGFAYYALNWPTGIYSDYSTITTYSYDAFNRRILRTDTIGGAISQTYASDITEEFGDLIGEDGEYIHQYDAQANTNALLDNTGAVSAQYKYFAFGQVSSVSIDGGSWTAEDWSRRAGMPLDFTSNMLAGGKKQYYLDQEIALYLLGSGNNGRYYDATTGRFLSEDPTKEAGGDENLYRYTGNDPVNNLDPSGRDTQHHRTYHPPQTQPT